MIRYDLHVHSTASDGDLSPSQVMEKAAGQGISVIALTDHDTTSGCEEAAETAKKYGMRFIPGIEITAKEYDKLHILGLGVDPQCEELVGEMKKCADSRRQRTYAICEVLASMGVHTEPDRINSSVSGNVGKPHIAREIVKMGLADSVKDAFDRFLTDQRIEAVKKYELGYADAVVVEGAELVLPAVADHLGDIGRRLLGDIALEQIHPAEDRHRLRGSFNGVFVASGESYRRTLGARSAHGRDREDLLYDFYIRVVCAENFRYLRLAFGAD